LNLWERHPESAELNLELGRLAAKDGDVDQALRYFHSAVYGDWQSQDAMNLRRETRLELYGYLISLGAKSQAQAELSTLMRLPPTADRRPGDLVPTAAPFFAHSLPRPPRNRINLPGDAVCLYRS